MKCGMYRGIKLLEHAMKIIEEILVKRWRKIVMMGDMLFGFMPGKCTFDAIFILWKLQEEY